MNIAFCSGLQKVDDAPLFRLLCGNYRIPAHKRACIFEDAISFQNKWMQLYLNAKTILRKTTFTIGKVTFSKEGFKAKINWQNELFFSD